MSQSTMPAYITSVIRHFEDLRDGTHGGSASRKDKEAHFEKPSARPAGVPACSPKLDATPKFPSRLTLSAKFSIGVFGSVYRPGEPDPNATSGGEKVEFLGSQIHFLQRFPRAVR